MSFLLGILIFVLAHVALDRPFHVRTIEHLLENRHAVMIAVPREGDRRIP